MVEVEQEEKRVGKKKKGSDEEKREEKRGWESFRASVPGRLGARYLVSSIDVRFMAQARKRPVPEQPAPPAASQTAPPPPTPPKRKWLSIYNEELWTRIW
jgi:hypothetical protein